MGSRIMALLRKRELYDPEQEEWPQYVERLDQFFEVNNLLGDGKENTLLERNWLSKIQLDWAQIHHMATSSLHAVLSKYDELFRNAWEPSKITKPRQKLILVLHLISVKPALSHM